jgi:hypothetical protein
MTKFDLMQAVVVPTLSQTARKGGASGFWYC